MWLSENFIAKENPIMGICLGMQLFFESSEEFGNYNGLGLVKGTIKKFPDRDLNGEKLKVPHIGWNNLVKPNEDDSTWSNSPLNNISEKDLFYFVHSFYVDPTRNQDVLSFSEYGGVKFCSSIRLDNLFATQFHPEKSAEKGLQIYMNWLK